MREIERVLRRGASTPHTKHHKGELRDHVLEIERILSTLTPPSSPLNEDLSVGEHSPHIAPCEIAATSASKNGVFLAPPSRSCVKLIAPRFFFLNFKHHSLWTSGQMRVHPA